MNKLEALKSLYKPYRYTIKGKCTILETTSGNFVVKEKPQDKDLIGMFNYLKSRGFSYFPSVFDDTTRNNSLVYEYIEENGTINPQKSEDLIEIVGLLHAKTSFNKEVTNDTYQEIYENIKNNILYLQDYYLKYYNLYLKSIYMSPSEYLLVRNYSKIQASLNFSLTELEKWYSIVEQKNSERISLVHNNLTLDHFIERDNGYLISWDKAKFDTPVLDLMGLYQNSFWDLEFASIYRKYSQVNKLNEEEEKLFFILISLVPEVKLEGNEFERTKKLRSVIDYVFKTEEFLKPYYATDTSD